MANDRPRPVGGYCIRQRAPGPNHRGPWKQPMFHPTLAAAFDEAERVARLTGAPYSILHEVGTVEPEVAAAPPQAVSAADILTDLQWGAQIECAEGGTEPGCRYCGEPQRLGHDAGCQLAASLQQRAA